jgi:hypothetical protein
MRSSSKQQYLYPTSNHVLSRGIHVPFFEDLVLRSEWETAPFDRADYEQPSATPATGYSDILMLALRRDKR